MKPKVNRDYLHTMLSLFISDCGLKGKSGIILALALVVILAVSASI